MPHNYQFYEDFETNQDRLNIENAIKNIDIPILIIHGHDDPSVSFQEAESLHNWNPKSVLFSVVDANHVFNAKHPWEAPQLPDTLDQIVTKSIQFII